MEEAEKKPVKVGGKPGTVGSQMSREGLKREGTARCCREVEKRAEKGQEASIGFGNTVNPGHLVSGFLGRFTAWSFE